MKNIRFENYQGTRLPKEIQMKRVQKVIREELTELQRYTLFAYYFQQQSLTRIARDRGVNRSTVCRTLHQIGRAHV